MTSKREILFLCHRIPYPPNKGDKIRSWRMLWHLAQRFSVHLGCFVDDPADMRHADFLRHLTASAVFLQLNLRTAQFRSIQALVGGTPISFACFNDKRMRDYVKETRQRPLAGEIIFSSAMAPYVAEAFGQRPRVIDLCDSDAEKWREYAETAKGPMKLIYTREARLLAAQETGIINSFDVSLAISSAEARTLAERPGVKKPVRHFGNGVDIEYFSPLSVTRDARSCFDVVFVGAMNYRANVEGVLWFVREVWPRLRRRAPTARFAIVGARPVSSVTALNGRDGVTVTGRVDDVRPYLAPAGAVIAPLRVARGVQNKVLEAMAMGRPVVATSSANIGVGAQDGKEIMIADTPGAFAMAVQSLLADREMGNMLGKAGRALMEEKFTWSRALAEFDDALALAGLGG